MTVTILCGGAGTRLWPASRPEHPKQFVRLLEGPTLFQRAVQRNLALADRFIIVANRDHLDLARAQFREIAGPAARATYILEPVGRNTAPAVALAALEAQRSGDDLMLVVPADHLIANQNAYVEAVRRASRGATGPAVTSSAADAAVPGLVTFGIKPEYPETGYGYIEAGEAIGPGLHRVAAFHEKPSRERAEQYLASGSFYWNSGMFVFPSALILSELQAHAPAMLLAARHAHATAEIRQTGDDRILAIDRNAMLDIPADSIDYAVMEKSRRVAVVPVSMGWDDLGSFDAVYAASARDAAGNALPASALALDAESCLVIAPDLKVRLCGVRDLIIVQDGDRLLIVRRGDSQSVKRVAQADQESTRTT